VRNKPAKFRLIRTVVGLSLLSLAAFIFVDAVIIEPYWVRVEKVVIPDRKLARSLAGLTLVQISDLHLEGELGFREKSLINRLNGLEPDFIFITGDLVESSAASGLVEEFIRALRPRYWIYGVFGNSDLHYLKNPAAAAEEWKRAGLSLIGGRSLRLAGRGKETFTLAGIDPVEGERGDLEAELARLFASVPFDEPLIALSYDPDLAPAIIEAGADLVLSGDTHGGLVGFPGWADIFHRYFGRSSFIRGLYLVGSGYLYVTRGIAPKVIPVRFLCPPEITVFQFIK